MPPWRIADRGTEEVAIVDGLDNVHALAPPDGRERRCAIGNNLRRRFGRRCPRGRRLKALLVQLLGPAIFLIDAPPSLVGKT